MDRCALFVDAGYALGDGALAVHGTRHRDSVSWDYAGLLKLLGGLARDRTGLPLLRCYWYDVATTGSRAAEHDSLADLPGVKLRLSKARPSRKEGVEAEMRRDLAALARNRAVTDVVIVSAEEDLAPAIAEVQEFGVRTVLLHIGAEQTWAGTRALRQECDDIIEVSAGHLRPFVDLIAGAEPQLSGAGYHELPVSSGQASASQPGTDAAAPRLFASPAPAGYERAPQLATIGTPTDVQRDVVATAEAAGFGAPAPLVTENTRAGSVPPVQPEPGGQPAQPVPLAPVAQYQQHTAAPAAGLSAPGDAGFGQPAFAGPDPMLGAHATSAGQPGVAPSPGSAQASIGAVGVPGNGLILAGVPVPAGPGQANGGAPNGALPAGLPPNGMHGGVPPAGASQPGPAGSQPGTGPGGAGQQPAFPAGGQGLPGQQLPLPPGPQPPGPQSIPPGMLPQPPAQPVQGLPVQPGAHRQVAGPGGPPGQNGLAPLDPQRPPLPGRQLPATNGLPYGQDRGMPYAGQLPSPQFGAQVGQQPYAPGGYAAQPQAQLPAPAQPPVPLPAPVLSVGDAVQAAHAEGFGFGEAVARDAPALWLEAVLARKPRMPSDLEARLLQGSALPIDSLLHDEVRHALRRGFWDALERSRH